LFGIAAAVRYPDYRQTTLELACEQAHVGAQARAARGIAASAKSSGEAASSSPDSLPLDRFALRRLRA